MKRIISTLLLCALLFGAVLPVSAAAIDPIAPQFKKIISTTISLEIDKKLELQAVMQAVLPKAM